MSASWITRRIALGGEVAKTDVALLTERGISHVLNCRSSYGSSSDLSTAEIYAGSKITYLHVPTDDDGEEKSVEWFHEGMRFVDHALRRKGTKCLIFCHMGINRSASMAYGCLRTQGYSAVVSERMIRTARPIVELRYQADAERAFARWCWVESERQWKR